MADTQRGRSASPSSPVEAAQRATGTGYDSATEPEATLAYNQANTKPPASAPAGAGESRYTDGPHPEAGEVDLSRIAEDAGNGQTVVTMPSRVYEEFPAPGAPDRQIRRLLYRQGQVVPVSALREHAARAGRGKAFQPVTETK